MTSASKLMQKVSAFSAYIGRNFMLLSISLILILGMFMGWICRKMKLPALLGMLITGIILGPYGLNLLDGSILGISAELRKIA